MDIYSDPFSQLGKALEGHYARARQATAAYGYPVGMGAKQHGRFMEFIGAAHQHELDMADRYNSGVSDAAKTVIRETGRQERATAKLKHQQGQEQAATLAGLAGPGTQVTHQYGEGYTFTTPTAPDGPQPSQRKRRPLIRP